MYYSTGIDGQARHRRGAADLQDEVSKQPMKQYIVDAFSDRVFSGNQAAVCVMDTWPEDALMCRIACENGFSETAFAVREGEAVHLRWFTPVTEIDFCGHATLAAAYVLFRFYERSTEKIRFRTKVGELTVERKGEWLEMDFPAYALHPADISEDMESAMGARPQEAFLDRDLLLVYPDERTVRGLRPDIERVRALPGTLVIATAPAEDPGFDCASRIFAPKLGIEEDPVTGSAHCMIAPYWAARLHRKMLRCLQASRRSGILLARMEGERVRISGKAVLFASCDILEDPESQA